MLWSHPLWGNVSPDYRDFLKLVKLDSTGSGHTKVMLVMNWQIQGQNWGQCGKHPESSQSCLWLKPGLKRISKILFMKSGGNAGVRLQKLDKPRSSLLNLMRKSQEKFWDGVGKSMESSLGGSQATTSLDATIIYWTRKSTRTLSVGPVERKKKRRVI